MDIDAKAAACLYDVNEAIRQAPTEDKDRAGREAMAIALRSMLPPPGHIMDETGAVRKVLGTLPMTADGCVVGDGAIVHYPKGPPNAIRLHPVRPELAASSEFLAAIGYSTPEAAEAARKDRQ